MNFTVLATLLLSLGKWALQTIRIYGITELVPQRKKTGWTAPSCRSAMTHLIEVNEPALSRFRSWVQEMLLLTQRNGNTYVSNSRKKQKSCCYFRFLEEKHNLLNRVKNMRALHLLLLSPRAGPRWVCSARSDKCVVTDTGLVMPLSSVVTLLQ